MLYRILTPHWATFYHPKGLDVCVHTSCSLVGYSGATTNIGHCLSSGAAKEICNTQRKLSISILPCLDKVYDLISDIFVHENARWSCSAKNNSVRYQSVTCTFVNHLQLVCAPDLLLQRHWWLVWGRMKPGVTSSYFRGVVGFYPVGFTENGK